MIVRARPTRFGMILPYGVRYGMGYVSPVGFADEATFQDAVVASFPRCPPPFDPTCEQPRETAISANLAEWVSNPQSCHNVVCNSSGAPAIGLSPTGQVGYVTTSGFVPTTPAAAPTTPVSTSPSIKSPVFKPSTGTKPAALPPVSPRPAPTPIQSSSAATAPGGVLGNPAAPTPVQTQTAPTDGSTPATAIVLASDCNPNQTWQALSVPPYGVCQDNPPAAAAGTTDIGSMLSSIPLWGWGVAALAAILIFRPGGKR